MDIGALGLPGANALLLVVTERKRELEHAQTHHLHTEAKTVLAVHPMLVTVAVHVQVCSVCGSFCHNNTEIL